MSLENSFMIIHDLYQNRLLISYQKFDLDLKAIEKVKFMN